MITIPEKHYLGMRKEDGFPLGFLTPHGTDAAAKKRIASVDKWAQSGYGGKLKSAVLPNDPVTGFKFSSGIRSSSYGGYDNWRILDPRGFELEISSGNVAKLMSVCIIDNGEIQEQCVWGREGSVNVLLSVTSEAYQEAVKSTKIKATKNSWKNAKPGNKVVLNNGEIGRWYGVLTPVIQVTTNNSAKFVRGKPCHVFLMEWKIQGGQSGITMRLLANPKLAEVLDNETNTPEEIFNIVNDKNRDYPRTPGNYCVGTVHALIRDTAEVTYEVIDSHETYTSLSNAFDKGSHLVTLSNGSFGSFYPVRHRNSGHVALCHVDITPNSYYEHVSDDFFNGAHQRHPDLFEFNDVAKFHKIIVNIKTPEGSTSRPKRRF